MLLIFPTSCSAHRSPRIRHRALKARSGVTNPLPKALFFFSSLLFSLFFPIVFRGLPCTSSYPPGDHHFCSQTMCFTDQTRRQLCRLLVCRLAVSRLSLGACHAHPLTPPETIIFALKPCVLPIKPAAVFLTLKVELPNKRRPIKNSNKHLPTRPTNT